MLRRLLLLFIVLLPAVSAARAQRLPGNAHPQHYSLELAPDLRHATFTGTVAIDLTLDAPARSITLNAAELQLLRAQVTAAGQTQTAEIAVDATQEQATFTVPQPLPAGLVTLRIDYTGVLNDRLRGFYLSRTATRRYAVSDFEPTNARRAFPSFDEPAAKATFDVSITADAADTAISNTPLIADHRVAAQDGVARHTLRFATTPRISTYLVAFLVGDFRCSKGKADGVPIRVCATPDKRGLTKYSLAAATHFLSYYNQYFGIPYPMPKLDLVALPDMEEGAMENFGCITFRETELLLDARSATIPARKEVARTIAHEMAHQWFGDMVTMHWWNDLWLNEGFASWMEAKATAAWHPEWGIAEDAAQDLDDTLTSDSYLHTRAIRADATTPDAINELFDDIAYDKSAAVLGMVESYLGEATFQQGVHDYLAAHLYGTATAEDFWNAQTAVSRQPVDAVMRSFLQQPGVPLLRLGTPQAGRLPVTQQRLLPEVAKPQGDAATLRWQVPVCLRTAAAPVCALLRPDSVALPLPSTAVPLFANAAGRGYYRVAYTAQQNAALAAAIGQLLPAERICLVGDRWALLATQAAVQPRDATADSVTDVLELLLAMRNDPSPEVLDTVASRLRAIDDQIVSSQDRDRYHAVLRAAFRPVFAALGPSSPRDPFDRQMLRTHLLELLGEAQDADALAEAQTVAAHVLAPRRRAYTGVDPMFADAAVALAAEHGDAALYDRMQALTQAVADPDLQSDALRLLARFQSPLLVIRTLDYAVSGQVKNQDSWSLIAELLRNRQTSALAWEYVQQHWPQVKAQLTTNSGGHIVAATGGFCTPQLRDEVADFFASHPVEAADRTLALTLESIDSCIRVRAVQQPQLHAWLLLHAPSGLSQ